MKPPLRYDEHLRMLLELHAKWPSLNLPTGCQMKIFDTDVESDLTASCNKKFQI
jgi:hypothetical protein